MLQHAPIPSSGSWGPDMARCEILDSQWTMPPGWSISLVVLPVIAGVVQSAAELLNVQQLEVSVRLLMVLGMLLPSNPAAAQQLADNPAGLQQLMELLKQGEDMDCKIIARDILGVLMKDESLRKKVEMAVRHAAQAAAAAGGAEGAKQ